MSSSPRIIPAVLETSFDEVRKKIHLVEDFAPWVQVDVCDGLFAHPETWREPDLLNSVEGKVKIEAHLMVEHPEGEIVAWTSVADRIIVHYEATDVLESLVDTMEHSVARLGVALCMDTPVEVLRPYTQKLSHIQLMGIAEIGGQGRLLDEKIFNRIKELRALYPSATITIDGGVTLDTISSLRDAGATAFVVGSALFRSEDIVTRWNAFNDTLSHGTST